MSQSFRTLILGGYGNFGRRIAKRLIDHPNIQLIIAGRDFRQAEQCAHELNQHATPAQLDIRAPTFLQELRTLAPNLIIHTAGPFQQQNYEIPIAAASVGAHYIDLADGRRFVCDFQAALHARFASAQKIAITGASTVPALSSAVINELRKNLTQINSIDICIAPAQTAPRGVATMEAILGYCGEPIQIFRNGHWVTDYGWEKLSSVAFHRLRPRLGALCDIPDLELFPHYYTGVKSVIFRAALEVRLTQILLSVIAKLRRAKLLPNMRRFGKQMVTGARLFNSFGSALGGMVVTVQGIDFNRQSRSISWHIAADHDHGPEIPCMAAILLARKLADGEISQVGAHPCMDFLSLSEFEPEFNTWQMQTDIVWNN